MHAANIRRKWKVRMNSTNRNAPEICAELDRSSSSASVRLASCETRDKLVDDYHRLLHWAAAAAKTTTWKMRARSGPAPEAADPGLLPPANVRRRAAVLLVDELAALAAGLDDPDVGRLQAAFLHPTRGPAAHALTRCGPVPADPIDAAAANAVAINWMELDEGFARASCHGALYTLPPLLAWAEVADATQDELLTLFAVAYEVTGRLAETWPAARFTRHPHADWSAIGAAIAQSLCLGHDAKQLERALDMASTLMLSGGYDAALSGARVRNLWAPVGIQLGMRAAGWASLGLEGPAGGLPQVMRTLLDRPGEEVRLMGDLGERWCVNATFNKPHACCQSLHSAIDAALDLRARLAPTGDWPEGLVINVETPRLETAIIEPQNRLQAQFSMPHAVAAALVLGHAGPLAFSSDALQDPRIARLREFVVLQAWSAPLEALAAKPARVKLHLPDAQADEVVILAARGSPTAPLSDVEILGKLESFADSRPGLLQLGRRLLDTPLAAEPWRRLWHEALDLDRTGVPI